MCPTYGSNINWRGSSNLTREPGRKVLVPFVYGDCALVSWLRLSLSWNPQLSTVSCDAALSPLKLKDVNMWTLLGGKPYGVHMHRSIVLNNPIRFSKHTKRHINAGLLYVNRIKCWENFAPKNSIFNMLQIIHAVSFWPKIFLLNYKNYIFP